MISDEPHICILPWFVLHTSEHCSWSRGDAKLQKRRGAECKSHSKTSSEVCMKLWTIKLVQCRLGKRKIQVVNVQLTTTKMYIHIYICFKQTVLQEIQMLAPECLYTPFIPKCQERVHCFKHFGARTSAALGKSPFEGLWHHNLTSKIVSWEQCLPGSPLHFSRDKPPGSTARFYSSAVCTLNTSDRVYFTY